MSETESGKRPDAPTGPVSEKQTLRDNKYGRSSAEATDLTREAQQQARKDRALRRRQKPSRQK